MSCGWTGVSEAVLALAAGAVAPESCCLLENRMVVVSCRLLRSFTSLCAAGGSLVGVREPGTDTQQSQTLDSTCQSGEKADSDPGLPSEPC